MEQMQNELIRQAEKIQILSNEIGDIKEKVKDLKEGVDNLSQNLNEFIKKYFEDQRIIVDNGGTKKEVLDRKKFFSQINEVVMFHERIKKFGKYWVIIFNLLLSINIILSIINIIKGLK
jgi:archaellum component FlaC